MAKTAGLTLAAAVLAGVLGGLGLLWAQNIDSVTAAPEPDALEQAAGVQAAVEQAAEEPAPPEPPAVEPSAAQQPPQPVTEPAVVAPPAPVQAVTAEAPAPLSFKSAFAQVAASVTPTIVSVILTRVDTVTMYRNPFSRFYGEASPFDNGALGSPRPRHASPRSGQPDTERRLYRGQSQGSGIIVSADGYILTSCHVIAGASDIQVRLADGRTYPAVTVGADSLSDVAVIRIKAAVDKLPVASLGDDGRLLPGDWVLAIGNPFSLTSSVSLGIVSALNREIGTSNLYQNFIQTDAAINPGNSGGALVNSDGQVIGVNTMIYTETGGFMGIGFAIPISMARGVMRDLIDKGRVVRGWIGISVQELDAATRTALNLGEQRGVLVSDVFPGQPAEQGGLMAGDVILAIDSQKIESANQLRNLVATLAPGRTVLVKLVREGEAVSLQVKICERDEGVVSSLSQAPADTLAAQVELQQGVEMRFGISLADLSPELRREYEVPAQLSGVVVLGLDQALTDSRASLMEGDVLLRLKLKAQQESEDIVSLRQFNALTAKLARGEAVLLLVSRRGETFFVAFRAP
jgi:serine protease Do